MLVLEGIAITALIVAGGAAIDALISKIRGTDKTEAIITDIADTLDIGMKRQDNLKEEALRKIRELHHEGD